MAGEVSFDVVSEFDEQELRNALDQVRREVQQRYDFKGVTVDLAQAKEEITLLTDDEHRATAVKDLIESQAIKRKPGQVGVPLDGARRPKPGRVSFAPAPRPLP